MCGLRATRYGEKYLAFGVRHAQIQILALIPGRSGY